MLSKQSAISFLFLPSSSLAQPLLSPKNIPQLFPALSATPLFGLLEGRFVWVPADDRTAKLLDGACVGTPAGGARSALDAAGAAVAVFGEEAVSAAVSAERGGARVCVRLSLEEAVFLVHVLGTLRVVAEQEAETETAERRSEAKEESAHEEKRKKTSGSNSGQEVPPARVAREMGGEELWRYACLQGSSTSIRNSIGGGEEETSDRGDDEGGAFLRSYAAFHHFRCKGWTVRSGLRYGCDFVLYQGHPAASHADVCVLAVKRRGGGGGIDGGEGEGGGEQGGGRKRPPPFFTAGESPSRRAGPLTWLDVEIGNRLAAQVGKRLLLLHIQVSRGEGGEGGSGEGGAEGEAPLVAALVLLLCSR